MARAVIGAVLVGFAAYAINFGAWAQSNSGNANHAAELFRNGVELMKGGQFVAACPLIAQSLEMEGTPGKTFTLAECERNAERIATASALYIDYLRQFSMMTGAMQLDHQTRATLAQRAIEKLTPDIPTLTVHIVPELPPNARVFRDDVRLDADMLGISLPVDPGEHVVRLEVPGKPDIIERLHLEARKRQQLTLQCDKPNARSEVLIQPIHRPDVQRPNRSQIAAMAAGGTALVGLTVGSVTGGMTASRVSEIKKNCPNGVCNDKGFATANEAQRFGAVSTIGFGVGIAAAATGAILFFVDRATTNNPAKELSIHVGVLDAGPLGAVFGVRGGF